MRDLEISAVDKMTIVALDESGAEYRVRVDEATLSRLKRSATSASESRVSPREIQTLLRSGLSNTEVGHMTGATQEQVEKYAGPILAERDYVVTTAQTLPAFAHVDTSSDDSLFGQIIAERLEIVDARDRAWTAWKDADGRWILKLTFTVSTVERDARWNFDAKRAHVLPVNDEAIKLSSPGTFENTFSPTLRAVPDQTSIEALNTSASEVPIPEVTDGSTTTSLFVEEAAAIVTNIDPENVLEALRKRRNSSDDAPAWLREDVSARTAPVEELFQDSLDFNIEDTDENERLSSAPVFPLSSTGGHKRNRPQMPKWNDIVSETKSDDDLI
jgi:hypothetical protein